jgi:SET domain-containing protein
MALLEKDLIIADSTIPNSGKGLFTTTDIPKGTLIVEYKGIIKTWKDVLAGRGFNGYVYFLNRNHVIDARPVKKALARYANDTKGISKIKGVNNNTEYTIIKKQVFIKATKNIPAGAEIFVGYGKEYWDVVKENIRNGV